MRKFNRHETQQNIKRPFGANEKVGRPLQFFFSLTAISKFTRVVCGIMPAFAFPLPALRCFICIGSELGAKAELQEREEERYSSVKLKGGCGEGREVLVKMSTASAYRVLHRFKLEHHFGFSFLEFVQSLVFLLAIYHAVKRKCRVMEICDEKY